MICIESIFRAGIKHAIRKKLLSHKEEIMLKFQPGAFVQPCLAPGKEREKKKGMVNILVCAGFMTFKIGHQGFLDALMVFFENQFVCPHFVRPKLDRRNIL